VLVSLPTKPSLLLYLIQPDALASETSLAFAKKSSQLAEILLIKIIIVLPILNMSAIAKQHLILK
jgi:hypothetical protein